MKINIESKEMIKMRVHAELFSPRMRCTFACFAFFMAVIASVAAQDQSAKAAPAAVPAAAEQKVTTPADAADPADPQRFGQEISKAEEEIMTCFAEIENFCREEKYDEAMKKFDEAKKLLDKFSAEKAGTAAESLKQEYAQRRLVWQHNYARYMLKQCKNAYVNMISGDLSTAAEQSDSMQKKLLSAKFMYYMGTYSGEQSVLDGMIARDGKSDFSVQADALKKDFEKLSAYSGIIKDSSLEVIDPGYAGRQKDIKTLYHEGEILYRDRRFTQARDKMEQILILDPYNEKAMQMLTRIYRKLYMIADMRAYNEMLHDQAIVEWRWMENIPREQSVLADQDAREFTETNSPLYEKAKKLIIPSVEFIDRGVTDAIDYLREKSKEIDPERVGIQIMIPGQRERIANKRVTFSLQNVPLYDAIRYLCLQSDLRFRINEKSQVIVIGLESEIAKGDTKDKIYIPIRRATVHRMIHYTAKSDESGKNSSSSSNSDDLSVEGGLGVEMDGKLSSIAENALAKIRPPDYSEKLRKYFTDLGFQFPDETFFVSYDARKNRIVVQHTPETLRRLELLIREIDVDTPLVLMEAKIIEISMNDYEELGFDWTLTHQNVNPRWSFAINSPMRASPGKNNILVNNMNVLPNFGSDNAWSLFLTVNAIDRTDRAEILSSPKLMAKDGEPAVIRMVRQMYFPESWSEPEISTSCGSSVTLEPSVPEFGDATDVGVIFSATATVSPNNYTINLELAPSVVDLVGWSDYSYEIVFGDFGTTSSENSSNGTATNNGAKITMKMPELSRREVTTKVKVYDGQTVVIGGMMVDRQTRQDDQWPILGEVPLFGRLFKQDYTAINKQNLLISVTSRLISGDGVPLRSNPASGLPDFRR